MRPTEKQIKEQLDKAFDGIESGSSRYPGMSYEEGVNNAISWMLGDYADPPFDEED